MRKTNERGAGIDYCTRLRRKILLEDHCGKPKLVTMWDWAPEGSERAHPFHLLNKRKQQPLHVARVVC